VIVGRRPISRRPELHVKTVLLPERDVLGNLRKDLTDTARKSERNRVAGGKIGRIPIELGEAQQFGKHAIPRAIAEVFENFGRLWNTRAGVGPQEGHKAGRVEKKILVGKFYVGAAQGRKIAWSKETNPSLAQSYKIDLRNLLGTALKAFQLGFPETRPFMDDQTGRQATAILPLVAFEDIAHQRL